MHKTHLLTRISLTLTFCSILTGCAFWRVDPMHVLVRSDIIKNAEDEAQILKKARVSWTSDGKVRVLHVQGTPYERGYQHGALLREEVQDNLGTLYKGALATYRSKELFAEAFERLRPHIPQDYIDEMHGLAHGSKLPLEMIHHIHALPSMTEWGGKKRIKKIVKRMIAGDDLGTSCSNFSAGSVAASDDEMYTVRILDWGLHRVSKLHEYPLLTVGRGNGEVPYVNIGWVGFLGAVSGMNAEGITLGEMGYSDPPNETLRGKPMVFLLREVLSQAKSLADVREIIGSSIGTNSFGFLMSDGQTGAAEFYVKDRDRFLTFQPGEDLKDAEALFPGIEDVVYAGHYDDRMHNLLKTYRGKLTPQLMFDVVIPGMVMKSNFQNVLYAPRKLNLWVSNAASKSEPAAQQPYVFFDFGTALEQFP